jgi:hypothetical protein
MLDPELSPAILNLNMFNQYWQALKTADLANPAKRVLVGTQPSRVPDTPCLTSLTAQLAIDPAASVGTRTMNLVDGHGFGEKTPA